MKKYKNAQIYDAAGDLKKRWFVFYYYLNPENGRFARFREYASINREKSLKGRKLQASNLQIAINDLLKRGFNPYADNAQVSEAVQYQNAKSLIECLEEVIAVKKSVSRARTWNTYRNILNHFIQWMRQSNYENMPAGIFSKKQAQEFADYLSVQDGIGNRTRNNKVTVLKAIFSLLVEREILAINPWVGIKKLRIDVGRNLAFSTNQQNLLKNSLKESDPELYLFVQFIYYCFIRPKELLMLQIRDFDFEAQVIRIPAQVSKNRRSQLVSFPVALIRELACLNISQYPGEWFLFGKMLKPSPVSILRNRVSERHSKFLKQFNLGPDYSLYSWKHTGVVRAFEAGIHIKDLQAQLRHHSLDMVNIYLKSLGLEPSSSLRDNFPEF